MRDELLLYVLVLLVLFLLGAFAWLFIANLQARGEDVASAEVASLVVAVEMTGVEPPVETVSGCAYLPDNSPLGVRPAEIVPPRFPIPETLTHAVYVWERRYDDEVLAVLRRSAPTVERFMVLAAEVSWQGDSPRVKRTPVDWSTLHALGKPVGLVVRIEPFAGPFRSDDGLCDEFVTLITSLVAQAQSKGVDPVEVQVDYDAAESKLLDYRRWLLAFRGAVHPKPLTITTLPVWLKHEAFAKLVHATDGYVLQVHSPGRPPGATGSPRVCYPDLARRWVAEAAKIDVPFRIALPTYGLSLRATNGQIVLPDAKEMTDLMAGWTRERPAMLCGFVWYRLSIASDTASWSWPALEAVIEGSPPRRETSVAVAYDHASEAEVYLVNTGTVDVFPRERVQLSWQGSAPTARETLSGFGVVDSASSRLTLRPGSHGTRLAPGERLKIAVLKFPRRTTVTGEVVR